MRDLSTVSEILAAEEPQLALIELELRTYVEHLCSEIAIEIGDRHWFRPGSSESRLKRSKGVTRAFAEKDFDPAQIWEIDDIVGVRVVVLTLPDARSLADRIMLDPPKLTGLGRYDLSESSGYRAIHLKGWSRSNSHPVGCEIQVRTAVQDAWAVVSRHDLYENETAAEHVKRTAKILSDQLATVDASFELIQDEARRAPAVGGRVRAGVGAVYDSTPLNAAPMDAGS